MPTSLPSTSEPLHTTPGIDLVRERLQASIVAKQALLADEQLLSGVLELAALCAAAIDAGNKVILAGNGGSSADATHLAAELVGRYLLDRRGLPALSLSDNSAAMTSIGNDFSFDAVYARQVEGLGRPGDVLIGLSTSGSSANVVNAMRVAREMGMRTAALTGAQDGPMAELADITLRMPAQTTARIQECHMLVGHTLCELIERTLFPDA